VTGEGGQTPFIDIPSGNSQIQASAAQSGNATSPGANTEAPS